MMGADQSQQDTKPDQDKRPEAADQESSASTPDPSGPGENERSDWSDVKNRNQLQTEERELEFDLKY